MAKSNVLRFKTEEKKNDAPSGGERKQYEDKISRQMDELEEETENERQRVLGKDWLLTAERLYLLTEAQNPLPSFRPRLVIPEIQMDMLHEASDLSDTNPLPYIVKRPSNERDEAREKAFQAHWRLKGYNLDIMESSIWSLFAGVGYIQVGYDPDGEYGDGEVFCTPRHPGTVFQDPHEKKDQYAKWVMYKDMWWIDDVRQKWPENGYRVKSRRPGAPAVGDTLLRMPKGPMTETGGNNMGMSEDLKWSNHSIDSRVCVRTLWIRDMTRIYDHDSKDIGMLIAPTIRKKYPGGRLIVECEGVVLYDGENPWPLGIFPHVSIPGMPPIFSHFAPQAIKYTKDLQDLAQRMYTQAFENAVRVNNGITYIDENTNIDDENFGGVPGEAHWIAPGSRIPETKWPEAMPAHMMQMPQLLLDKAKEINAMTPARKGSASAGNISAPLYDAAVMMSQSLTRLRARYLARSVQRLAHIIFVTMGTFYKNKRAFPSFEEQEIEEAQNVPVEWDPIGSFRADEYMISLDEASIRPFSQAAMKTMVPVLKQLGMLDARSGLEMLDVPNAEKIEKRLMQEAAARQKADMAKKAAKGGKK